MARHVRRDAVGGATQRVRCRDAGRIGQHVTKAGLARLVAADPKRGKSDAVVRRGSGDDLRLLRPTTGRLVRPRRS